MEREDWRLWRDGDGGVGLVSVLDYYVELVFRIVLRDLTQLVISCISSKDSTF